MSLKPIDKRKSIETRQALWDEIRRVGVFTVKQLREQTCLCLGLDTVREYITALTAAGYLECLGEKQSLDTKPGSSIIKTREYQLIRNIGVEAPRVRRDGSKITMGDNQERMWRVMRILREFSAIDVVVTTSTENSTITLITAKSYIHQLKKAGYLAMTQPGRPGYKLMNGTLARYILLPTKNTGPKPPMVQRGKQIFDQNLQKVVWTRDGL